MIIESGLFGLLGHNGAGKTTFMNILATLLEPTSGNVIINDIKLQKENYHELRKIIGYLPQEFGVYPHLTVYETLDYFGILNEIPKSDRKTRIDKILKQVNLHDEKGKKFKNLSGGMKRRLGLGIALINEPKILIVDEPTAGVDPTERIKIRNLLVEMAENHTVILSTHVIEDVVYTCHKLAVFHKGRLTFNGTVDTMLNMVNGKIWEMTAEPLQSNRDYKVISQYEKNDSTILRVLCERKPTSHAIQVEATMEDAYIAINKIGEVNETIFSTLL